MTSIPPEPPVSLADLSRRDGRTAVDTWVSRGLAVAGVLAIVISVLIVGTLLRDAVGFLGDVDLSSLWGDVWRPRSGEFGIRAPLIGTLWVTLIGSMVAGPIGLGAAVYLSEYSSPRVRRTRQAHHRGAGQHPVGGHRRVRLPLHRPGDHPEDLLRQPHPQPAGGRHRRRPPVHPAHDVGLRGRPAGRSRTPSRGVLRARCPQDHHRDQGRDPRVDLRPGGRPHPHRLPGGGRDHGGLPGRRRQPLRGLVARWTRAPPSPRP